MRLGCSGTPFLVSKPHVRNYLTKEAGAFFTKKAGAFLTKIVFQTI